MENLLESLFYVLWRGIAIGIMISAPMGPVGMLCIQRTLNKGRLTGLYTGVGAALSDLFYCLLTGFGLSFIEDFLTRNQDVIQLVGSLVLIGFAVYLFKKAPTAKTRRNVQPDEGTPHKDILGGFLFTFANPLILFLIIGLFARFNFLSAGLRWYYYILGYIAIAAGALGWWWFVTYSVDKVRAHFNLQSMGWINRIIGGIILIFGIVGIVTGVVEMANATPPPAPRCWNISGGFSPWSDNDPGEALILDNSTDSAHAAQVSLECGVRRAPFAISWRLANLHATPAGTFKSRQTSEGGGNVRLPGWSVTCCGADGERMDLAFRTIEPDHREGLALDPTLEVTVRSADDGKILASGRVRKGDPYDGVNRFTLSRNGGTWTLKGGNRPDDAPILTFEKSMDLSTLTFSAEAGGRVMIDEITLKTQNLTDPVLSHDAEEGYMSPDIISHRLRDSEDDMEGVWRIFNRDMDESLLRTGGDYSLALLADDNVPGKYSFYYLGGARINSDVWRPGMLKGWITPSPFDGIYEVTWIDAMGRPMNHEITASLDEQSMTLSILFPYQKSTLRLRLAASQQF